MVIRDNPNTIIYYVNFDNLITRPVARGKEPWTRTRRIVGKDGVDWSGARGKNCFQQNLREKSSFYSATDDATLVHIVTSRWYYIWTRFSSCRMRTRFFSFLLAVKNRQYWSSVVRNVIYILYYYYIIRQYIIIIIITAYGMTPLQWWYINTYFNFQCDNINNMYIITIVHDFSPSLVYYNNMWG